MCEYKQKVTTDQLQIQISLLKTRMLVMGYKKHTCKIYEHVWGRLLDYAKVHEIQEFSPEYSQKFIKDVYGEYYENKYARYAVNKPITVLLDFIRLGVIIRQKNCKNFSDDYKDFFESFIKTQIERGLANGSIITLRSHLYRLENFLLDLNIKKFSDVTRNTVNLYIESFMSCSTSSSSSSLREFGRLCDYALTAGFHIESFSSMIPHVKNLRRQRLPHIFTADETLAIIEAVDRNNPLGKRNYAMLIMTAKLGLRIGDVRILKFSSIDWNKKVISITQSKTGKFLELPLPDDVGWAIIDYMKNGRPTCDNEIIFINHNPPYNELSSTAGNLVAKYMRKAGIKTPTNKVCGMHTLRHSLASGMLAEGIPVPTISSILGHADINSTEAYLRVDIKNLRKCALEVDI